MQREGERVCGGERTVRLRPALPPPPAAAISFCTLSRVPAVSWVYLCGGMICPVAFPSVYVGLFHECGRRVRPLRPHPPLGCVPSRPSPLQVTHEHILFPADLHGWRDRTGVCCPRRHQGDAMRISQVRVA